MSTPLKIFIDFSVYKKDCPKCPFYCMMEPKTKKRFCLFFSEGKEKKDYCPVVDLNLITGPIVSELLDAYSFALSILPPMISVDGNKETTEKLKEYKQYVESRVNTLKLIVTNSIKKAASPK